MYLTSQRTSRNNQKLLAILHFSAFDDVIAFRFYASELSALAFCLLDEALRAGEYDKTDPLELPFRLRSDFAALTAESVR